MNHESWTVKLKEDTPYGLLTKPVQVGGVVRSSVRLDRQGLHPTRLIRYLRGRGIWNLDRISA